jgi:HD superfamily phosphodiesterase
MAQILKEAEMITLLVTNEEYILIQDNVTDYILSFQSDEEAVILNYKLKKEHINRVVVNAEILAKHLNCEESYILIAKLVALLHDIGRFEQFRDYQTFNDYISKDHSEIGLKVIEENNLIANLQPEVQEVIKKAVSFHNKIAVPKDENKEVTFFSNIIRDADKLDILEMAISEYSSKNNSKNSAFSLELKDSIEISKPIEKSVLEGKLPDRKEMKTITDFKLVQMAFVYDLNFKESFSIVGKRQYLKHLFDTMPKNDRVFEMYRRAKIHVENHF